MACINENGKMLPLCLEHGEIIRGHLISDYKDIPKYCPKCLEKKKKGKK